MKPLVGALLAVVFATAPATMGCAGEDAEERAAAYPEPIGYTPPSDVAASQPPQAPEAPPYQPVVAGEGQAGAPVAYGQEVVIGGPDDGAGAGAEPLPPGAVPGQDVPQGSGDYADTDPAALTDFRTTLDPYGSWSDDPTYGTVWRPSASVVGPDFVPYESSGHWTYDDDDYTWVSDYEWGWAPFHYGRWVVGPGYGWEWIPGRSYAGAWVSWRYGEGGYVGWAPLGPTWCWRHGAASGLGFATRPPYVFVGTNHLFAPALRSHVAVGAQVGVAMASTRPFVAATPAVGGRVTAHPGVGPSPSTMHVVQDQVVHASSNRGVLQARAFSHAGTAESLGARAPQVGFAGARSAGAPAAYGPPAPSHFGGRLGGGFVGSAATAPPMRAPYNGPVRSFGPSPGARSQPVFRSAPSGFSGGSPAVAPHPTFRSPSPSGSVHSAPSVGGGRSGGGGGHSGGRGGHR